MRADEVRAAAQLARLTPRGSTTRVHEFHRGIADRAFTAVGPAAAPVRRAHDVVAGPPTCSATCSCPRAAPAATRAMTTF